MTTTHRDNFANLAPKVHTIYRVSSYIYAQGKWCIHRYDDEFNVSARTQIKCGSQRRPLNPSAAVQYKSYPLFFEMIIFFKVLLFKQCMHRCWLYAIKFLHIKFDADLPPLMADGQVLLILHVHTNKLGWLPGSQKLQMGQLWLADTITI